MIIKSAKIKGIITAGLCCLCLFQQTAAAAPARLQDTVFIHLKLSTNAPVKIRTAPLKYNKHLAFSFTLDDGYRSAYLSAYPLLHGGQISPPFPDEWKNDEGGDGTYAKGLFFSDGCGQVIPFRLAVAINAAGINDMPLSRGHMSWPEVQQLYQSGWDVFNHGYHHATKHGTDYESEAMLNQEAVKKQLGFTMSQFIVPGGEADKGYELLYEKAAFKYGSLAVGSINGAGPAINVKDPVDLTSLVYRRNFIKSDSIPLDVARHRLKALDSLMKLPDPVWLHEFTHGVGNSNLWSLSIVFPEFKYYMTSIAQKYGSSGNDNMWMAPWQEVYEYIWLRDRIRVIISQKGKDVIIKLAVPDLPAAFRYHATSLTVQTSSAFTVVSQSPDLKISYKGKGDHKLVNIQL